MENKRSKLKEYPSLVVELIRLRDTDIVTASDSSGNINDDPDQGEWDNGGKNK